MAASVSSVSSGWALRVEQDKLCRFFECFGGEGKKRVEWKFPETFGRLCKAEWGPPYLAPVFTGGGKVKRRRDSQQCWSSMDEAPCRVRGDLPSRPVGCALVLWRCHPHLIRIHCGLVGSADGQGQTASLQRSWILNPGL